MNAHAPPQVGDVLASKYRIDRILGEGAMGIVVAATHLELGTQVAVKFMLPAAVAGHEGVERFLREARAACRLRSEHVCRVLDVGRLETGAPYIVMEMLEGEDLQGVLDTRGVVPIGVLARYAQQICEAIGEAHALGIVQRDLKPQNLFLVRKFGGAEVVKVLDFGISKLASSDDAIRTHHAAIMGTPAYMSPEQCQSSAQVDGRTDIWAIGVILYQLSSGRLPFDGSDFLQLAMAVMNTVPPPPSTIRGDLPPSFDAVVMRCLAQDRERRFATAQELAAALEPFVGLASGPTPPMWAQPTTMSGTGSRTAPGTTLSGAAGAAAMTVAPRRRTALVVGGVGVAAAGALLLAMLAGGGSGGGQTETPGPAATSPAAAAPAPSAVPAPVPVDPPPVAEPAVAVPTENAPAPVPPVAPVAPEAAPAPAGAARTPDVPSTPGTPSGKTARSPRSKPVDLHVGTLTVDTIEAERIKAKKIEAEEIEAKRIEAESIKANKIEVKDEDVFKK